MVPEFYMAACPYSLQIKPQNPLHRSRVFKTPSAAFTANAPSMSKSVKTRIVIKTSSVQGISQESLTSDFQHAT
jgi:hypothetical protein